MTTTPKNLKQRCQAALESEGIPAPDQTIILLALAPILQPVDAVLQHSPWAQDRDSENTPMPWCFYCGASSWGCDINDHRPECEWLKANGAAEVLARLRGR